LHYPAAEGGPGRRTYPISAIYGDTPPAPTGPLAHPGLYTVRLTADGRRLEQQLTLKMDPRVKTPQEGLEQQFALSMQCYEGMRQARTITAQIQQLRADLRNRGEQAREAALKDTTAALDRKLAALAGTEVVGRRGQGDRGTESREPTFGRVQWELGQLLNLLQSADVTPTSQAVAACSEVRKTLAGLRERWRELSGKDLQAVNEKLREGKLAPITLDGEAKGHQGEQR
jgi:hypothetical protein